MLLPQHVRNGCGQKPGYQWAVQALKPLHPIRIRDKPQRTICMLGIFRYPEHQFFLNGYNWVSALPVLVDHPSTLSQRMKIWRCCPVSMRYLGCIISLLLVRIIELRVNESSSTIKAFYDQSLLRPRLSKFSTKTAGLHTSKSRAARYARVGSRRKGWTALLTLLTFVLWQA